MDAKRQEKVLTELTYMFVRNGGVMPTAEAIFENPEISAAEVIELIGDKEFSEKTLRERAQKLDFYFGETSDEKVDRVCREITAYADLRGELEELMAEAEKSAEVSKPAEEEPPQEEPAPAKRSRRHLLAPAEVVEIMRNHVAGGGVIDRDTIYSGEIGCSLVAFSHVLGTTRPKVLIQYVNGELPVPEHRADGKM